MRVSSHLRALSHLRTGQTSAGSNTPILHIHKANAYQFGDVNKSNAVFRDLEWRIRPGESWAIVGSAGGEKSLLLEVLNTDGLYPFLARANPPRDPHDCISSVSFSARPRSMGGDFYDFTARYGAVREEDRVTLRQTLFADAPLQSDDQQRELAVLATRLDMEHLLDLPMVALSNGQTRRARIMRALLAKPELLLLDEPLTGLDVQHRPKLLRLLGEINASQKPRIIMALRSHDPFPEWVTHVARVDGPTVQTGRRDEITASYSKPALDEHSSSSKMTSANRSLGKELVSMENVNVRYDSRHVLKDINWTIREGERWHLQGANGSGKTTLLSLVTGDHPQSYAQPHLNLFSLPRRRQPTVSLQQLIGSVSPELYNAFPRRLGPSALTVRDAIATGFESTFSYRPRTPEMDSRINELLHHMGPKRWATDEYASTSGFEDRPFGTLSPGEQSLVLLLRALAGKPPLLILDEVFAGMDNKMTEIAKTYLRDCLDEKQAVVFVTHWEEEVPWDNSMTRKLRLENGYAKVI